ncbi:MAG: AtpZ/AtpI family protein [Armatimonadetes bacterium]|nr:AtpZ/AtpI family protein [Armatimonadota bacterium]
MVQGDDDPGTKRPQRDYKWMVRAGQASTIGWVLVISPLIGFAIGDWIDGKLHSYPWATIIFLILGVAAGFYEVIKLVIRLSK